MPKSCIPHYDDTLAEEQRLRNAIFLEPLYGICGIPIQNITPFLLARLLMMGTPYLDGGEYTDKDTLNFLWALSPDHSDDKEKQISFVEMAIEKIPDIARAEAEIDVFLQETFMDGPGRGVSSVPYVSGIAWLVYQMGKKPFCWKEKRTMHTALRKIYQLMRCRKLEKGGILYNEKSDMIKARWLDTLNANRVVKGDN